MSIRKIFTIARNEIYTLFYSPIAWVMLALFTIVTSIDYIGLIDSAFRSFKLGGFRAAYLEYLSRRLIFEEKHTVFYKLVDHLYIFIPLMTMGLISREISSGTIKLLYSSPLRVREIVLGKYLAIVAFAMCMTAIATLLIVGLCFSITNPDIPQLIATLCGLFLIMCCYAAVGLFISSLTSYQIVAALVTCAVLGFLNRSALYWQEVDLVRNITFYLNLPLKSVDFLSGLVNLRDFSYLLILIGTFLGLTMVKLKSGTESISQWRLVMRYVAVIAIASITGYITSRKEVNIYWDTTRGQDFTITKPTRELLEKFDEHEFDVTLYVNILDQHTLSKAMTSIDQNFIERDLELYTRFKPDINLRFVYYYYTDSTNYRFQQQPGKTLKEIAQNEAKQMRLNFSNVLTAEEVSKLFDVKSEEYNCFFHIRYGDQQMVVRTFVDQGSLWPSEYEYAAAWQRLIIGSPKVLFLSGEMERDPFDRHPHNYFGSTALKTQRYSLLNQGFDVDTLSLNGRDVPESTSLLVVADPRLPLSVDKTDKIKRYIDQGGNLFLLTEPDSWQNVQSILDKLGVTIKPGMIVQPNEDYSSDVVFPNVTDTARNFSPFFLRTIKRRKKLSGDTVVTIPMPTVSAIEYTPVDGFTVEPLLITDGRYSWNRIAPIPKDSLRYSLGKAPGDQHGDFVTSVRMYRNVNGKEQRIIVASDADYVANGSQYGSIYCYQYQLWCYRYFTYGKFPVRTIRPESIDDSFKITYHGIVIQRILFCWILPGLLLIVGTIILIRRRRK